MKEISDALLMQRLRNRIIEVLEMLTDSNSVIRLGTEEILECWYDYIDEEKLLFYKEPVFTGRELSYIKNLYELIESKYEKIPSTWAPEDLVSCESWVQITKVAWAALHEFQKRGYFDEENEIAYP